METVSILKKSNMYMKSSFINKTSKYKNIRSHINTLHYPVVYHTVLMTPDIMPSLWCIALHCIQCAAAT